MIDLPKPHPERIGDKDALDRIAVYLGSQESWNGGDVCEMVAEVLAATGRPPVGDQTREDLSLYRRLADELGYDYDE